MKIKLRSYYCYLLNKCHGYLWVRDSKSYGLFLTITEDSIIDLVKVTRVDSEYRVYYSTDKYDLLIGYPYDFYNGIRIYSESTLEKSPRAEPEISRFLSVKRAHPGVPHGVNRNRPNLISNTPPSYTKTPTDSGKIIALSELCTDLGISETVARSILRKTTAKPAGGWKWKKSEIDLIRSVLTTKKNTGSK